MTALGEQRGQSRGGIVGRAIAGKPEEERPYLFTKCGLRWSDSDVFGDPVRCLRPDSIRQECDASLRRLGVERIDLYQFHWPDGTGVPVEDSWAEMGRLIEQGKVRAGAVSNFDVDLLERCEKIHHVGSLQPPFSLIDGRAGAELAPWCAENGTGLICYSPLQAGLLTDTFSAERLALMDSRDWRRWHIDFTHFAPPALQANLALRDRSPAPHRRAPRRDGRGCRRRVGAQLAGRDRRDRRPALARPGGRLDRRRRLRPDRRRPRRDRGCARRSRRRRRADETAEGELTPRARWRGSAHRLVLG
ncbi:aldo/keto reductase [Pseudonocardia sp. Cha107L01]|uniref:aldo/keto reductase n=1 Tax=Pseudonocardia sp. Cha107L01 TaxID=3457576 RepID=UPI00403EDF86